MIKTVEIINFQSHKDTVLELSEGVNVIKGRSHGGKSSVVRALKWALLNQPRGDHFVSHFKGAKEETQVGIEFAEPDSYIIRKRGAQVNGYDLPTTELAAVRSDIPEEVSNISKMGEINIQTQDKQYYMVRETAGTVAKELNKLVGLDIIDKTISKLNKLENENTVRLKLLEKDWEEVQDSLKELDFIDDLEKKVKGIEDLWEQYETLLKRKGQITSLVESIEQEKEMVKETKDWLTIKVPVSEIRQLLDKHSQMQISLHRLKSLYSDIREAEIVRQRSASLIAELKNKIKTIKNSQEYKKEFCPKCGAHISHWRK